MFQGGSRYHRFVDSNLLYYCNATFESNNLEKGKIGEKRLRTTAEYRTSAICTNNLCRICEDYEFHTSHQNNCNCPPTL